MKNEWKMRGKDLDFWSQAFIAIAAPMFDQSNLAFHQLDDPRLIRKRIEIASSVADEMTMYYQTSRKMAEDADFEADAYQAKLEAEEKGEAG